MLLLYLDERNSGSSTQTRIQRRLMMTEVLTWVEIPAADFERAVNFYKAVIGPRFNVSEFMGVPHGFLNNEAANHGGAVIPNHNSSLYVGPIVYIGVDNLDESLKQVEVS